MLGVVETKDVIGESLDCVLGKVARGALIGTIARSPNPDQLTSESSRVSYTEGADIRTALFLPNGRVEIIDPEGLITPSGYLVTPANLGREIRKRFGNLPGEGYVVGRSGRSVLAYNMGTFIDLIALRGEVLNAGFTTVPMGLDIGDMPAFLRVQLGWDINPRREVVLALSIRRITDG